MSPLDVKKQLRSVLETQLLLMWERKLDGLERGFVNALRAFFTRQGREIVKLYKETGSLVYDGQKWRKELAEIIAAHHAKAIVYGHQRFRAEATAGIVKRFDPNQADWDGVLTNIETAGADVLGRLIVGIDDTTRKRLADYITSAISAGLTTSEIASGINEKFDQFKSARARTIARTETSRAANFGYLQTAKQLGFKKKRWLTALDEHVCPVCQSLNGKIISIEGNFTTSVHSKEATATYSVEQPPAHVNCRCTMLVSEYPDLPSSKPSKPSSNEYHFNKDEIEAALRDHGFDHPKLSDKENPLQKVWKKWKIGYQRHIRQALQQGGASAVLLPNEIAALSTLLTKVRSGFTQPLWRGVTIPKTASSTVDFIKALQPGDRLEMDMRGWSVNAEVAKGFATLGDSGTVMGVVWHMLKPAPNRAYPMDFLFPKHLLAEEKEVLVVSDKYTVVSKMLLTYGKDSKGNRYPVYQIDLVPQTEEGDYL